MPDSALSPEDFDALAGEHALGLLTGDELAQALRLQLADPAFAQAVEDWHERLASLHGGWRNAEPSAGVWDAIAARIESATGTATLRKLSIWRGAALTAGAVAASLALFVIVRQPTETGAPIEVPGQTQQFAVAQLTGEADGLVVVARYDPVSAEMTLRTSGIPASELAPELWIIPADGTPRSLGLIDRDGASQIKIDPVHAKLFGDGVTLAVTMEPAGTAPHKAPSSSPVAAGTISII